MCKNMWERSKRLNRPRSSSSGRYAGVAGHVITSAYNGCAVEMINSMCADIPWLCVCAHDWIQYSTANVLRNGSFVRLLHWNYIKCLNVCFPLIRLSPLYLIKLHRLFVFALPSAVWMCAEYKVGGKKQEWRAEKGEKRHLATLKSQSSVENGLSWAPECSLWGPCRQNDTSDISPVGLLLLHFAWCTETKAPTTAQCTLQTC